MFTDFYDYLSQILSWCELNCLTIINKKQPSSEHTIINSKSNDDLIEEWVDYGFGENEVIH